MANKIILKKSSTASKVPLSTDLDVGELAVNLADAKLYTKNAGGTVIQLGGGSGSGDVVGPASATDNALARFDGTTGKLIQNGTITQDDTGNLAGILSETYDTVTTPPTIVEALEAWDSGNGTLEVGLKGGNVSYKYGQQEFVRAYNGSGSAMTKGQVVYIVGAQGNRVDIRLAKADSDTTSASTIGFVVESIASGAEGWVQVSGSLYKLDTSALTAGATLYLSPTTAGAYTTTAPTAPQHRVILGWVERVSATVGSFYVKVDNGYELDELHNVLITSPTSGNTLIYDAVQGVWENANISAGTGISVTNGAGSISIGNTGVTSFSAGTTGLTPSTGSTGAVTLAGTLAVANGGTGVTTSTGSGSVVLSIAPTLSGITVSNTLALNGATSSNANFATAQTTGTTAICTGQTTGILNIGGTAQTGTITLGRSTVNHQIDIQSGATASGSTKTVNLGTNGLSGSTTNITIGSVNGTTATAYGAWTFNTPLAATNMVQATTSTSGYLSSTDWNTFNGKAPATSGTSILYGNGSGGFSNVTIGSGLTFSAGTLSSSGGSNAFDRYEFVATASQTTFAVGVTLSVIQVFVNGALQKPTSDYTISTTNVVLTTGAPVGAIVTVYVYSTFNVSNTYTQSAADALFLSQTSAASTYLTQANASSTYLTQSNASSTYLTQSNASSTYLTQANATSTYLPFTGGTLTGQLKLNTGSATAGTAPIELTAGTLNTVAEAGAIEYDGKAFYSSVANSTRGVTPSEQLVVLTGTNTLTSQTAVQPIFDGGGGSAGGAVTLPIGTYEYELSFALTGMSATSGSFGFGLGGTATKTFTYQSTSAKAGTSLSTGMATLQTFGSAANTALQTASTGTVGTALIKGIIRVTVAGTVIPQVSLTVAAAAVIQAGSYFKVSPLGNETVATVGNWS